MSSNRRPFSAEKFQELFSQTPRLCIDLIIKINQGILLTKRAINPLKDYWHLPGGTVLFNETIEEAVQGIAQEELGINVKNERQLGYIEFINEDRTNWRSHSVSIAFLCSTDQYNFELNSEASELVIFPQIPSNIIPEQQSFIIKNWHQIM